MNNGNGNGNGNGSSTTSSNWRFSRKRLSFPELCSATDGSSVCKNGETSSSNLSRVASSTKIVQGNGSNSFGLRRRYSFESFELKKGSSSGRATGSWPGGGRGGSLPQSSLFHPHQYSSLPLPAKRLSCRVLPTSTTLEPIPPSPTAPEDEDIESSSSNHKDNDFTSGSSATINTTNSSVQNDKEGACGNNVKPATGLLPGSEKQTGDKDDDSIFEGQSANNELPSLTIETTTITTNPITTLETVTLSPGEILNLLFDELFYELALLFTCLQRGQAWLVRATYYWYSTYYYYSSSGCGGDNEDIKIPPATAAAEALPLINPNDETRHPPLLSKVSSFSSSLLSVGSRLAATAMPVFTTFCTAFLRRLRSGSRGTLDFLRENCHQYHKQLCNKILTKAWRQKEDGRCGKGGGSGDVDEDTRFETSTNDDEQQQKKDGKDQMTNYADDDAHDLDDSHNESGEKVSDEAPTSTTSANEESERAVVKIPRKNGSIDRFISKSSCSRSPLTSTTASLKEKVRRARAFIVDGDYNGNLIVYGVVTLMALMLVLTLLLTVFYPTSSTPSSSSSQPKLLSKSVEGLEKVKEVTKLMTMTMMLMPKGEKIIDSTTDFDSLHRYSSYREENEVSVLINKNNDKKANYCKAYSSSSLAPFLLPTSKLVSLSNQPPFLEDKLSSREKDPEGKQCKVVKGNDYPKLKSFPQRPTLSSPSSMHYFHCTANHKCDADERAYSAEENNGSGSGSSSAAANIHKQKRRTTVDEPQEGKDELQRNAELEWRQVGDGTLEAEVHQSQEQQHSQEQLEQRSESKGENVVLKEPEVVPQAQLDSHEQAVWFVLSVLFTVVSSSCALTLLLVYLHKSFYHQSSSGSLCSANWNTRTNCYIYRNHSSSSESNHFPISTAGTGRGEHATELVHGYQNAPVEDFPLTRSDPRSNKVTGPSCPSSRGGVNLVSCQSQQRPTTEGKPIQREQDQYCHHHHQPEQQQRVKEVLAEEDEEKSPNKSLSSFPTFPRESGTGRATEALPLLSVLKKGKRQRKGKCSQVAGEGADVIAGNSDVYYGSCIKSGSTCSPCQTRYCCCAAGNRASKSCSVTSIHDPADVRQQTSACHDQLRNGNGCKNDEQFYGGYDKWKSASGRSIRSRGSTQVAGYCYDGTTATAITTTSNCRSAGGNWVGENDSGLLTFASTEAIPLTKARQQSWCTCYLCRNGDGSDKGEKKQQCGEGQGAPRKHYNNGDHYRQVDSTVTLVDRGIDVSLSSFQQYPSSVNCISPCYACHGYNRYCFPTDDHNQTGEQQQVQQPSKYYCYAASKYFLHKFCQPDKVLFPIFWTALLVDFNFPNCCPLLHALVLGVAIKFINLYHHYGYFSRLWGGVPEAGAAAVVAIAAPQQATAIQSERDKEKCDFFSSGSHYQRENQQAKPFADSAHDNKRVERAKDRVDETERRELVEERQSWDCSHYHRHHHQQQQLPSSCTFCRYFPSEKESRYHQPEFVKATTSPAVTGRTCYLEEHQRKVKEENCKERVASSLLSSSLPRTLYSRSLKKQSYCQQHQHHHHHPHHLLLLFRAQKHNLLGGSSKLTISLWLYFILIRRLGSFLHIWSTGCNSNSSTYLHYFPAAIPLASSSSAQLSFCFIHLLGIFGLLFGQLCVQRLGCPENYWNYYFPYCWKNKNSITVAKENKGENHHIFPTPILYDNRILGAGNRHRYSSPYCSSLFSDSLSKTNNACCCAHSGTPHSSQFCRCPCVAAGEGDAPSADNNSKEDNDTKKQEGRKCTCNFHCVSSSLPSPSFSSCCYSSNPFGVPPLFPSTSPPDSARFPRNFNLEQQQSEQRVSFRENKERERELPLDGKVKAEQFSSCFYCTHSSSSFSFQNANNQVTSTKNTGIRNDFEYHTNLQDENSSKFDNSYDSLRRRNRQQQQFERKECSCSYYYCWCNQGTRILKEKEALSHAEYGVRRTKENCNFRKQATGGLVCYNKTATPASSYSCTNFSKRGSATSSNHDDYHQRSSLLLHPRRVSSCDSIVLSPNHSSPATGAKKSSKRIAFLLHTDNQEEKEDNNGESGCVVVAGGKVNSKRNSPRQNNPYVGGNLRGSNSNTASIRLIDDSSTGGRRRKKCLQFEKDVDEREQRKAKEGNKNSSKNPGTVSLPQSLLCADAANYGAASHFGRDRREKGEQQAGSVFGSSCRKKVNGIGNSTGSGGGSRLLSTAARSSSSCSSSDEESESTPLGSNSRSSSSGSLVLVSEDFPEEFKSKVEGILRNKTAAAVRPVTGAPEQAVQEIFEEQRAGELVDNGDEVATNDDNNNNNHDHNSNDDESDAESSSGSTEASLSRRDVEKAKPEVISESCSTSTTESSVTTLSSSPNPETSAELESSSNNTGSNPKEAAAEPPDKEEESTQQSISHAAVSGVVAVTNCVVIGTVEDEDLSYVLYYNHVNNNSSDNRCQENVETGSGDAGLSDELLLMRTGGIVLESGNTQIKFQNEAKKGDISSGGGEVNPPPPPLQPIPSTSQNLQQSVIKTKHMNCKGLSKKGSGSSSTGGSGSISNEELTTTTATIIPARKGSSVSTTIINRVPTPPPSLTSTHTSILAGLGTGAGGASGGRERKTYISHKFITTTGVINPSGSSATSNITVGDNNSSITPASIGCSSSSQGESGSAEDDGGATSIVSNEPMDNPHCDVLSQSEPLSSSITTTATASITILPKNDTTSSSTTSLTPSSSSAVTGNTAVLVDGADNATTTLADDSDNSNTSPPPSSSQQLPPPPSPLQVDPPLAPALSAFIQHPPQFPPNHKRLFRSGSQCCVNSSTSSSPILSFQQSSTPPQQLLHNNNHQQYQQQTPSGTAPSSSNSSQQNLNNQQGSIEKYLSSKMRRTSLPAALPAQRTAGHHVSTINSPDWITFLLNLFIIIAIILLFICLHLFYLLYLISLRQISILRESTKIYIKITWKKNDELKLVNQHNVRAFTPFFRGCFMKDSPGKRVIR